jgi:replicative DNA helicase
MQGQPAANVKGERLPPHSTDAEKAVLGAMLHENECIDDVALIVRRMHFYNDWTAKVFQAIFDLHQDGKAADLVTVADVLDARGQVADIGGYHILAELWEAAPTSANAEHYARIVADKANQRAVIQFHATGLDRSYGPTGDVPGLIEASMHGIQEIADGAQQTTSCTKPIRQVIRETLDWLDCRQSHPEKNGVPTGFIDLDEKIGGFHEGELIIVAARPSVGKTALACQLAVNAARAGMPVFFVSLEQSVVELGLRLISCESKIDGNLARKGVIPDEKMPAVTLAADCLETLPIIVDDTPNQNIVRIASQARRLHRKHGLRMVVVDYLQLIDMEKGFGESREQKVAATSRSLKTLSRELRVPVIALAQLNRQVEGRAEQKPKLSDLRDSGSIEQDADVVLMLWRPDPKNEFVVEVVVEKQRNGPTGPITLTFLKHCTRFENHAVQSPY